MIRRPGWVSQPRVPNMTVSAAEILSSHVLSHVYASQVSNASIIPDCLRSIPNILKCQACCFLEGCASRYRHLDNWQLTLVLCGCLGLLTSPRSTEANHCIERLIPLQPCSAIKEQIMRRDEFGSLLNHGSVVHLVCTSGSAPTLMPCTEPSICSSHHTQTQRSTGQRETDAITTRVFFPLLNSTMLRTQSSSSLTTQLSCRRSQTALALPRPKLLGKTKP